MGAMISLIIPFLISTVTSILGAISGIGGGVILRPALDALTGLDTRAVSFMSGCTVFFMSALSLIRYKRTGVKMEGRKVLPLAVGAAVGGLSGNQLFAAFIRRLGDSSTVAVIQSSVLCALTLGVIVYMRIKTRLRLPAIKQSAPLCFALGLALGVLSSFLGIGGGPMNVAAISFFLAMNIKSVAPYSLSVIFLSQLFSLLSVIVTGSLPTFDAAFLLPLIAGGLTGAWIGTMIARKASPRMVEKLFTCVLWLVAAVALYNVITRL